jgi:tRNA(fMet)-specific endonuclease VapC
VREPAGRVTEQTRAVGLENVAISIFVAAELRSGAIKRKSKALSAAVEELISRTKVLAFEVPANGSYAKMRADLAKAGTPVGANDMFIAAIVLALGATLVTDNVRKVSRIKSLKVENCLR